MRRRWVHIWLAGVVMVVASLARAADEPVDTRIARLFAVACDLDQRALREREAAEEQLAALGDPALRAMQVYVRSERTLERQIAVSVLGKTGDARAEMLLLGAIAGDDPFAAHEARRALATLYSRFSSEERWRRLNVGEHPQQVMIRLAALFGAFQAAQRDQTPLAAREEAAARILLASEQAQVRLGAVTTLRYAREPATVQSLLDLVARVEDPRLWIEICRTLQSIAPAGQAPRVVQLAQCGIPEVELEAIAALHAMGYGQTAQMLDALAMDEDPAIRARAIALLGETNAIHSLGTIARATRDTEPAVRVAAVRAIGRISDPTVASEVRRLMGPDGDVDPTVRALAAVVFDRLGQPGAIALLLEDARAYDVEKKPYRVAAIQALGELRAKRATRALLDALAEPDADVSAAAAEALGRIGERSAGPALLAMLRSDDAMRSRAARMALTDLYDDPGPDPQRWDVWARRVGLESRTSGNR